MDQLRINGGRRLNGSIQISGAKNAALPSLAATLLTDEEVILGRIPSVRDIRTMAGLIGAIGPTVVEENGGYRIQAKEISESGASYERVKTMRASSLVLGPLVARTGRAHVSLPGGCAIGARPIDIHLLGLQALGAEVRQEAGYIEASAPNGLRGAPFLFPKITVTGTEDLMMAAALAKGETVLQNAAREPEVVDLANMLAKMGAKIEGAGTSTLHIQGVDRLRGCTHDIIPDRIETGTYIIAGALAANELELCGVEVSHLSALLNKLAQAGVDVSSEGDRLIVRGGRPLIAVDVTTEEHPGFPTDMQAQWMALMLTAQGDAHVTETIFENRFMHVAELGRMGAKIELHGNQAAIRGGRPLTGARVMASDLRASACLVLAALAAEGETIIDRVYHLDRGYENLDGKLAAVGASIERVA